MVSQCYWRWWWGISSGLKAPCSTDVKSLQVFTNLLQLAATCMCQTMPEEDSNRRQPSALPQLCKCTAMYMRHDTPGITLSMYAASTYLSVSHEQQFSDDPPCRSYKVAKLAERCSRCFALELYHEYCRMSQFRGKADRIKTSPHLPSAVMSCSIQAQRWVHLKCKHGSKYDLTGSHSDLQGQVSSMFA